MKYLLSLIIIIITIGFSNAQCFQDRHNTTWFDSWISCTKSSSPNSIRGESHWIMYDLSYTYKLEKVHFWNVNDPKQLDNGAKDIVIDYSLDGSSWTEFGTQSFDKASGKSIYEGEEAFSFNGVKARYVLLTILDNWGGDCYGFGEIKIGVSPITATEMVSFNLDCNEKDGYTELKWSLENDSKSVAFEVEKSFDQQKWTTIYNSGNIAVKTTNKTYKYQDNSTKDAYYRIKISDNTGGEVYTNPQFCSKSNIIVNGFPNPFISDFKVDIVAQNDEPIIYSLNDIYGRVITKGIINNNSTITNIDFNNLGLTPGNYFFIARQGSKIGSIKMVKMNTLTE